MSWLDKLKGALHADGGVSVPAAAQLADHAPVLRTRSAEETAAQQAEWDKALRSNRLPSFVQQRLKDAGEGKTPWISTMTPAELRLARTHAIRPVATVSGTCWYHYGFSWTNGHAEGWHAALARIKQEALAAGANAVVDVKMRTIQLEIEASMDYTLVGTAVKIEGLPPSRDPIVSTVPALEFVRLLEAGIVPVGLAIGAHYEWLTSNQRMDGSRWMGNQPLNGLGLFWESVRRKALRSLRDDAARQGSGVLAHTHFGQILKGEGESDGPERFLARHIVIGTVIDSKRYASFPYDIRPVVDMRDDLSPLLSDRPHGHNAYSTNEEEGAI
jgi:hypothetical protein